MPIREGRYYCINHSDQELVKNSGFNALIRVDRSEKGVVFNPSSGIPLVIYYCPVCGYIESYTALTSSDWHEAENKPSLSPADQARDFESRVSNALSANIGAFGGGTFIFHPLIKDKGRIRRADAVIDKEGVSYVFEFKSIPSRSVLDRAVMVAKRNAEAYKEYKSSSARRITCN